MCPVCAEAMVILELHGVEVDRCVRCGGTWLDAGEMERILELAGAPADDRVREISEARKERRTERRCPRCPRRLDEIRVGNPAVVLDRCPWGHGLWCDRGEMETLVRSVSGGEGGAVARFFGDLYQGEMQPDRRED
jgi:Zn-finger nucleic acid-binding protein